MPKPDIIAPYPQTRSLIGLLSISFWVTSLMFVVLWGTFTFILFPFHPIACTYSAATIALLLCIPQRVEPPSLAKRFLQYSMRSAWQYFPVTMIYEDKNALEAKRPFVIGLEPHSVLPQALSVFGEHAPRQPPAGLRHARILVSSTIFRAPIIRHFWWWMGCRPASWKSFEELLKAGRTVAICPGGVRECMYMTHGQEVAYLKRRTGFVRLAVRHKAALVPVFAFGQTPQYSYIRLLSGRVGLLSSLAARMGFVPMVVWGLWGLPFPRQIPLRIVVGVPIEVTCDGDGSDEEKVVEECLAKFIEAMEVMYKKYRKEREDPAELIVY